MIKFLSVDGSTSCTGIAYFEYNPEVETPVICHNVFSVKSSPRKSDIVFSKTARMFSKLIEQFEQFNDIQFDCVVFENYAFNGTAVTQLAELNGLLKNYFVLKNVPIVTLAPKTVKKVVAGNGNSKKEVVRQAVELLPFLTGKVLNNFDESDAVAVGYAYIKILQNPALLPQKKIKKPPVRKPLCPTQS
jgi:Holliday junction resolvasome RuvABC endonuclease subunit